MAGAAAERSDRDAQYEKYIQHPLFLLFKKDSSRKIPNLGYILTEMRNLRYDGAQLEGRFVLLQAPYDCVELGAGSAESAADGRSA